MIEVKKTTPVEESAEFLAAWNAPAQPHCTPAPVEETPEFLAAWNAPAGETSSEESADRPFWYQAANIDPWTDPYWH